MDFIPTSRLIFAIVAFGFVFFFLNLGVNAIITVLDLNSGGPYIGIAIFLFTNLPAVALFGNALKYIMDQQKRVER